MWSNMVFPLVGALLLSGCWLGNSTPPDWILSPQTAYPADRYLVGIGEGTTRDQAEKRAYAAVARIFSANVQATSLDQESYSLKEANELSSTHRSLHIDQQTRVTTTKLLENVKVLEAWYRPFDQQFVILAGLDRHQTAHMLMARLNDLDKTIEGFVAEGRTHSQKIHRIQGYKQALALLQSRHDMNTDLRVIRASGEGILPPYTPQQLQREFMDFVARSLIISVAMEGENSDELEGAIWEGLKREGLLAGAREQEVITSETHADITISGTGRLWTVDLPDPLFRYVRWCGDVQIRETESDRLVGVISRSGREGHITDKEARVRASKVMQEVISQEVARLLTHSVFSAEPDESLSQRIPNACPY
ncbi:MAG TPA: LPP20 family lipoprotein [Nitrospirales bacterium]|nr:LPP20 family lipoprotein [Nitrospirales bacterium]